MRDGRGLSVPTRMPHASVRLESWVSEGFDASDGDRESGRDDGSFGGSAGCCRVAELGGECVWGASALGADAFDAGWAESSWAVESAGVADSGGGGA